MAITKPIPEYRDDVKNKFTGILGIVDASYNIAGIEYIDVIVGDEMHYKMRRSNWEVTKKYVAE
jgi:hypothetical protein